MSYRGCRDRGEPHEHRKAATAKRSRRIGKDGAQLLRAALRSCSYRGMLNWKEHDESRVTKRTARRARHAAARKTTMAARRRQDPDSSTTQHRRTPSATKVVKLGKQKVA